MIRTGFSAPNNGRLVGARVAIACDLLTYPFCPPLKVYTCRMGLARLRDIFLTYMRLLGSSRTFLGSVPFDTKMALGLSFLDLSDLPACISVAIQSAEGVCDIVTYYLEFHDAWVQHSLYFSTSV